jgi:AcrR family transcriptional regulator
VSELMKRNKLTGSQRHAAELFATIDVHKKTNAEIAEECGVSERTVYRWKQDPEFIAFQNAIAEHYMEDVISEAYARLKTLLRDGKSEKTQLEALKLILQNRGKLKESHEHKHEVKQAKSLDELEAEVFEMEQELLD